MNFFIWLVIGGAIGCIANLAMGLNAQKGLLLNIAVGMLGALLGGWFITLLLGQQASGGDYSYSPMSIFASLASAVFLLALVHLFRHGSSH